ncbi:SUMF1/EgtB/PvdO family nonheme iron enzyme [candidate division KSB1 bacterium]|nr:SUMF1/EgtB/PvdO family nonheme iron enzyme [candidate division KSB1 bacterium]
MVGSNRVNRGGCWNSKAQNCRSANRDNNSPENRNDNIGFRLVFVP